MSQDLHLSDEEAEERFHITGSRAVAFTLAGYARDAVQFSVQFGDELFVTTLLAVQADDNRVIFECSGAESLNRSLLKAEHCRLAGRPDGIRVYFDGGRVSEVKHGGRAAFAVTLPKSIVRLQRRDSFRIATPRVNPLRFFARLPDGKELELPAFDISITGIGLLATQEPEQLTAGLVLERCRFRLPEETQDLLLAARIQHITA
ncbi:MAG TPA: flagellar regulator YcgR PilZN domain-containing protein, partial [Azonexus sp.]